MTTITPAAQRLYEHVESTREAGVFTLAQCQELVDVVLNMDETPDHLIGRLAGALRQTLTMMSGSDEQWDKMARQVALRAGLETERNGS